MYRNWTAVCRAQAKCSKPFSHLSAFPVLCKIQSPRRIQSTLDNKPKLFVMPSQKCLSFCSWFGWLTQSSEPPLVEYTIYLLPLMLIQKLLFLEGNAYVSYITLHYSKCLMVFFGGGSGFYNDTFSW